MDLLEGIYTRRSIRKYTDQAVAKEDVEKLIEAAIMAPSASNSQTWAFVVIQDKESLKTYSEKSKELMLKHLEEHGDPYGYKALLSDPDFNVFYNANTLIIIYSTSEGLKSAVNCALAAENLMLAAHAKGLGTCWIGFSVEFFNSKEFKNEHGIGEEYTAVAPIIVGYPAEKRDSYSRKEPKILVWK